MNFSDASLVPRSETPVRRHRVYASYALWIAQGAAGLLAIHNVTAALPYLVRLRAGYNLDHQVSFMQRVAAHVGTAAVACWFVHWSGGRKQVRALLKHAAHDTESLDSAEAIALPRAVWAACRAPVSAACDWCALHPAALPALSVCLIGVQLYTLYYRAHLLK